MKLPSFIRHFSRCPDLCRSATIILLFTFAFAGIAFAQDKDDTDRAIALFNKGQEEHEKGNFEEAIASYKSALEIIEEFPEAEFQLAAAYKQTGKLDLAERSFRRAVELREDWSLAHAGLGAFLVDTGKYSDAEEHLTKAIELDEQNFPAIAALVELRIRTNANREGLRELFDQVAVLSSKANPPASLWVARGSLETALGDKAAGLSFRKALEIEPGNRPALKELTYIAIRQGDTTAANELIKKIESKAKKDDPEVTELKARVLLTEGRNSEADRLLASIPNPSGEVKQLRSEIAAATSTDTAALEKQAAEDPGNITAISRLCVLYRTQDPTRALAFCRRASELEPDNMGHAIGYGAALVQTKDYAAAIGVLRRLSEISPYNSTIRANLATALFHAKRYAEAKTEYRWLTERQPDLAVAYYFLGIVHDQLGEYLDAAANYQQFLKIADPAVNQLEIEKVNLRMPVLQRQIKNKKGR